jgi:hypothetical protein
VHGGNFPAVLVFHQPSRDPSAPGCLEGHVAPIVAILCNAENPQQHSACSSRACQRWQAVLLNISTLHPSPPIPLKPMHCPSACPSNGPRCFMAMPAPLRCTLPGPLLPKPHANAAQGSTSSVIGTRVKCGAAHHTVCNLLQWDGNEGMTTKHAQQVGVLVKRVVTVERLHTGVAGHWDLPTALCGIIASRHGQSSASKQEQSYCTLVAPICKAPS